MSTLRPYQAEAVEQTLKMLADGSHRTLIIAATGLGKTQIFCELIRRSHDKRRMVIAHREELISQAASRICQMTGEFPAIEKAELSSHEAAWCRPPVVVASIQTLISGRNGSRRMDKFLPSDFGLLIIDEAHHAVSSSYRAVLDHFGKNDGCKIVGVTATPDRHDEKALGQVFDSVAYNMGILDAILEGWLVRPQQLFVPIEGLDFSECRRVAGDLNGRDLEQAMTFEEPLYGVAAATVEESEGRPTIVFATTVAHAERLAEIINRYLIDRGDEPSAVFVCGKTLAMDRQERIRGFLSGKYRYLVNVGITTEGFDAPDTACVVMARPTLSRSLYEQMLGRGTRPAPGIVDAHHDSADDRLAAIAASGKPDLLIIDFVGNSGRHKLINSFDVLGGNWDDDVIELAVREAQGRGEPVDVKQGIDVAEHAAREARRKAEEKRRLHLTPTARYQKVAVDPFDALDLVKWRPNSLEATKPASEKMVAALIRFGIPQNQAANMDWRSARQLVGSLIGRMKDKLCTYKQAKLLRSKGLPTDVSMVRASEWITAIANNGWMVPDGLRDSATKDSGQPTSQSSAPMPGL